MRLRRRKYWQFEPTDPTPSNEICRCRTKHPVKLMHALSENPIHCIACNLEVPPRRLALERDAVDAVAHWNWLYAAIYRLELDSGSYEAWATRQLQSLGSPVNALGLRACQKMQQSRRCYYARFQTLAEQARGLPLKCTKCGQRPSRFGGFRIPQSICNRCSLIWWAADAASSAPIRTRGLPNNAVQWTGARDARPGR
jgi:hypothetical protein